MVKKNAHELVTNHSFDVYCGHRLTYVDLPLSGHQTAGVVGIKYAREMGVLSRSDPNFDSRKESHNDGKVIGREKMFVDVSRVALRGERVNIMAFIVDGFTFCILRGPTCTL